MEACLCRVCGSFIEFTDTWARAEVTSKQTPLYCDVHLHVYISMLFINNSCSVRLTDSLLASVVSRLERLESSSHSSRRTGICSVPSLYLLQMLHRWQAPDTAGPQWASAVGGQGKGRGRKRLPPWNLKMITSYGILL